MQLESVAFQEDSIISTQKGRYPLPVSTLTHFDNTNAINQAKQFEDKIRSGDMSTLDLQVVSTVRQSYCIHEVQELIFAIPYLA